MSHYGFSTLGKALIILGSVVIAGIADSATGKPNQSSPTKATSAPTARSWKAYSNKQFGFSLRYPSNGSVVDDGPFTTQSGTQPSNLGTIHISWHHGKIRIQVFDQNIVQGDYDWPERPCGEWSLSPDDAPLSSEQMSFARQKTLHVMTRS